MHPHSKTSPRPNGPPAGLGRNTGVTDHPRYAIVESTPRTASRVPVFAPPLRASDHVHLLAQGEWKVGGPSAANLTNVMGRSPQRTRGLET